MVMELFAPRYRAFAGCFIEAFWATGVMALALIAKYIPHWRYTQLVINAPMIPALIYIWFIPESFRWLLFAGKLYEAEAVIKKLAALNGILLDPKRLKIEMRDVGRRLQSQNCTVRGRNKFCLVKSICACL